MSPKAILSQHSRPCFVCGTPTMRLRSATHLNGRPTLPTDFTRICLACDEDWTAAVTRALMETPPNKQP